MLQILNYQLHLIIMLILSFFILGIYVAQATDLDALRTFGEVCTAHGYRFEAHNVTTSDGYILTLFRIPGKEFVPIIPGKPVVFLQHGLLDLADTWITNQPCQGFMFSDAGYDVWFGNSRGSYHSLGHVKWNYTTDPQYWQFTWQHMADYDIPSSISFVLQSTKQQKLTYIGHSQGTLIMFAHLASNPSFINNLNIFIALAPVGSVRHMGVPMFEVLKEFPLMKALEDVGVYEFLPNHHENLLFYEVCYRTGLACEDIINFFAGVQVESDNTERFPIIMAHEPGGTSTLNMEHWQQMTDYFLYKVQKFNYGKEGNLANYGQTEAPIYDMSKIPGPIAIFSGDLDRLADPTDVKWLESAIPKSSVVFNTVENNFGHQTFLWGNATAMEYFNTVIQVANQYKDQGFLSH